MLCILTLNVSHCEHQDCIETMMLFLSSDQSWTKGSVSCMGVLVTVNVLVCTRVISQTRGQDIHVLLHSPL